MFSLAANQDLRMGRIMTMCRFVSEEDLEQSLQFANVAGIPVGKALIFMNFVSEQLVEDVLKAQELIRNEIININEGRFVLQTAELFKITFSQALEISYLDPRDSESLKFGNLLKIMGVSPFKIKLALKIALNSGKKIGETAFKLGFITQEMQKNTLKIQESLSKLQAPVIERSKMEKELRIRLTDLLVNAGCIDKASVEEALSEKPSTVLTGNFLVEKKFICESLLNYALSLLCLIKKGRISSQFASQSIKNFTRVQSNYNVFDFLKACNFLCDEDEHKMITILDQNANLSKQLLKSLISKEMAECCDSQMLLNLAFRDENAMRALLYELRPEDKYLIDSALVFYNFAQGREMTLNQALVNFTIRKNQIIMGKKSA